jgi:hypothetical protein
MNFIVCQPHKLHLPVPLPLHRRLHQDQQRCFQFILVSPNLTTPPRQVLASAAVRLYKLNSSTGGYEAHAGGTPLGCVLVGSGVVFQLLIYNGQV